MKEIPKISGEIGLNQMELNIVRQLSNKLRHDANIAHAQKKEIDKLMSDDSLDLIEATKASRYTTEDLKHIIDNSANEDEKFHHADVNYQIITLGSSSTRKIPIVVDDGRCVFSDFRVVDIHSFISSLFYSATMLKYVHESDEETFGEDGKIKEEWYLDRLDVFKATCSIVQKMISLIENEQE